MIREVIYFVGLFSAAILFLFCLPRGRRGFDTLDTAGLCLPLVQALGNLCLLLFGSYPAKFTSIKMYGLYLRFRNPIPLYAIFVDICIFLFLKRLYAVTHKGEAVRGHFGGVVFASYLMIHASVRIVLNVFEKQYPLVLELTLTQLTMAAYILLSASIFSGAFYACHALKTNTRRLNSAHDPLDELKRLLFPAGLTVFYLISTFLIYYLTRRLMVWKWPIQPVESLTDAYARLFYYMPVMGIAALALAWMKKNNEPIRPWFKRGRLTFPFVIGLLASIYYCLELLVLKHPELRGVQFWPPVIMMSLMNACCEEIMYRLVLYRAIIGANYSRWVALIAQSVVYSLIHFMVVGAVLGLFSLVYGFLLGLIVQRSKSVSQAMVCHFIIDIGCIGMPMLRM
jgi:membrane protease YdiL (CAAX protease family)